VIPTRDLRNCGACDVVCTRNQYCGAAGCGADTLATLCDAESATFVLGEYFIDNEAAGVVRDAFGTACPAVPSVLQDQGQADGINPTTGRPVAGPGRLFVVMGGFIGQRLAGYLEDSGATRLFDTFDGANNTFWARSPAEGGAARVVARGPYGDTCTGQSCLTETHDYFRFETVVEPTSGTRTLLAYGMGAPGTIAAGWFLANRVLPSLSSFDHAWYVYEWRDTDVTGGPSSDDTFRLVESGD
jgi:hypothetical protein